MSRILLVLLVLGIMISSYFFLPPTEKKSIDSVSDNSTKTPLQADTLKDTERSQALTHIKNITSHSNESIDASTANHFVTENQLIQLPNSADASISSRQHSDTNNSNTAQTFGVSMPKFNPKNNTITNSDDTYSSISGNSNMGTRVTLKELLDQSNDNGKRIFYIHAVNKNDRQGIWGILQSGLTDTFAKGITLSDTNTLVKATIPEEADEQLANKKSSFLGKLLHNKATSTHIYNFQQGLLGQNPNLITPGQQLIIVTFTEEELLDVYHHYSQQGSQQ